ncbi:hypothetical protein NN561_002139 [Cricetulus griseus]
MNCVSSSFQQAWLSPITPVTSVQTTVISSRTSSGGGSVPEIQFHGLYKNSEIKAECLRNVSSTKRPKSSLGTIWNHPAKLRGVPPESGDLTELLQASACGPLLSQAHALHRTAAHVRTTSASACGLLLSQVHALHRTAAHVRTTSASACGPLLSQVHALHRTAPYVRNTRARAYKWGGCSISRLGACLHRPARQTAPGFAAPCVISPVFQGSLGFLCRWLPAAAPSPLHPSRPAHQRKAESSESRHVGAG